MKSPGAQCCSDASKIFVKGPSTPKAYRIVFTYMDKEKKPKEHTVSTYFDDANVRE